MDRLILPPSRPKRNAGRIRAVIEHYKCNASLPVIVFVRGHYLNTMGIAGRDDLNIYDDAAFIHSNGGRLLESYNANTNPSFVRRGGRNLAQLNLGKYRFYQGLHKGKYKALRAYPEGVTLPVTRNGVLSIAQYINIHKGSTNTRAKDIVWSEGCLTIPDTQYGDFIMRVYAEMDRVGVETVDVLLVENREKDGVQRLFDHTGSVII